MGRKESGSQSRMMKEDTTLLMPQASPRNRRGDEVPTPDLKLPRPIFIKCTMEIKKKKAQPNEFLETKLFY